VGGGGVTPAADPARSTKRQEANCLRSVGPKRAANFGLRAYVDKTSEPSSTVALFTLPAEEAFVATKSGFLRFRGSLQMPFFLSSPTYKSPLSRSYPYRDDLNDDDETIGFSAGICIISFRSTRFGPVAQMA